VCRGGRNVSHQSRRAALHPGRRGGGVAGQGNGIKEERFINFTRRRKGRTLRRGKSKRRRNRSG